MQTHVHVKDRTTGDVVVCDTADTEVTILTRLGFAHVARAIPDPDDRADFEDAIHYLQDALNRGEWPAAYAGTEYLELSVEVHTGPVSTCPYTTGDGTR